jgi:plastocyanin
MMRYAWAVLGLGLWAGGVGGVGSAPDTRGVADVIVSLTGTAAPPASPAAAAAPLVLDNRGCRFDPHVAVATVGSLLEAVNSDDVLHTIHLYGPRETNVSLPVEGARQTRVLATPGLFVVKCDVHGWMEAHLRVDEHPFHGVTDALGAFRIEAIPAGAQALEIWHEHFGTLRRELTITAGETTRLEIELTKENAR